MRQYTRRSALKLFGVGALSVAGFGLASCGSNDTVEQEAPQTDNAEQDAGEQGSSASSAAHEANPLVVNVSISGVSMSPVKVYASDVDSYEPDRGYVIQATVSNGNDVSCDVTPYFAVDLTAEDEYGSEQTQRVVIFGSQVFTPYGLESARDMQPVGLAPHETKDVRYYIYIDGSNPLLGSPLDDSADGGSDAQLGQLDTISLTYGGGSFNADEISSLANVEVVSYDVKESDMTYLAADGWASGVKLDEQFDDGSSWGGYATYEAFITGSVSNSTSDRWLSAEAQFDVTVSGQALNDSALRGASFSLDHVEKGASEELRETSVAKCTSDEYDIVLMPALLAYEPDEE